VSRDLITEYSERQVLLFLGAAMFGILAIGWIFARRPPPTR
jgi:hypothetical protein